MNYYKEITTFFFLLAGLFGEIKEEVLSVSPNWSPLFCFLRMFMLIYSENRISVMSISLLDFWEMAHISHYGINNLCICSSMHV